MAHRAHIVTAVLATLALSAPALAADSYQAGATALVSRSDGFGPLPAQADGNSWNTHHAISADGRFSVFVSDADDLGVADRATHVFVRDDQTGAVTLLDRAGPGGPVADDRATEASISADGSHACFITYAGLIPNAGEHHVYVVTIATGAIVLADRSTGGTIGNAYAQNCVLDADGNTVAFDSGATNLVGGVASGEHVYVRHLDTGTTQIADSYQGSPGDSSAYSPAIDASGTTVAFESAATNLIGPGGDTNGHTDVYVRALGAVQPVLASRATGAAGALGNGDSDEASMSADGSLVAFASRASNLADGDADVASDVHARNLLATTTTLVSRADGAGGAKANDASLSPMIAGDGSAVAFLSQATNLGAAPAQNAEGGANRLPFLRTLSGAQTTALGRASGAGGAVSQAGYHALSLDQHATNVVFESSSTELDALAGGSYSEVFQRHLAGAFETRIISRPVDASGRPAQISYLESGDRAISADGRYVVFGAVGTLAGGPAGVTEIYVRDVLLGTTRLVSRADGADGAPANSESRYASISADGTRVAFASYATNLPGAGDGIDSQVFVRDVAANTTTIASTGAAGRGNGTSTRPVLSQDGSKVAFVSGATNFAAGDTNNDADVFLHDMVAGTTTMASLTNAGAVPQNGSRDAMISADGTRVGFTSYAKDIGAGEADGKEHLYVRDVAAATTTQVDRKADGSPSDASTDRVSMSADGNRFLFSAGAKLTPDAVNNPADAYVRDVAAGTTTLVGVGPGGEHSPSQVFPQAMSLDGTKVVFETYKGAFGANDPGAGWVRDLNAGTTSVLAVRDGTQTPADSNIQYASMDADGNCVVFLDSDGALASPSYAGHDTPQLWLHVIGGECPVHAPDTTITSGPDGKSKVRSAYSVFAYNGDESGVSFACSLDSALAKPCSDTFHTGALRDGVHRFSVAATDRAGNTDPTPALVTFTVGVPPRITKLRLVHGRLVFKLSEKAVVRVRLARAGRVRFAIKRSLKAGTRRIKLPVQRLHKGRYRATVVATDAGGNRSVPKGKRIDVPLRAK